MCQPKKVNENLSPFMRKLAYYCRVLRRKGFIERVTTFKGIVKIYRTVGHDQHAASIIGHKQDLEKLFPNLDDLIQE